MFRVNEVNEIGQRMTGMPLTGSNAGKSHWLTKVPVSVSVRIAERKMDFDAVMQITPGSLITFSKPCDEPLDLFINNRHYGRGEAVKIGEHFGIKVMSLGPPPDDKPRVID